MTKIENPELELAYRYVNETNSHIFLTGKAGTGKTTFLRNLRKTTKKRNIVVAPTGVAAINAGGMTIHSLFQLAFGLLLPNQRDKKQPNRNFKTSKINLLRSLDLVIIDEVSMVRADIMDAIDAVLRRYRRSSEPFGGVQMLMIGDMHQLPPVLRSEERSGMMSYYRTHYFFGADVIRNCKMITVELKHIYRQADQKFIDILNAVRNNRISQETLDKLNERYDPTPVDDGKTVTLTTLRKTSELINEAQLNKLTTPTREYTAEINGIFNPSQFPNAEKLIFKEGARVMFIKNDLSEHKQYYNGKMGVIIEATPKNIRVRCDDDMEIEAAPVDWLNTSFELNPKTKKIEEVVKGSFSQYPLKLAWAITIHKSQGLTFDKVIIDAQNAFEHGQVYVALSRCKTLEGISLKTIIDEKFIKKDSIIESFEQKSLAEAPDENSLLLAKKEFAHYLLKELYDFSMLDSLHKDLIYHLKYNQSVLHGDTFDESNQAGEALTLKAITFASNFWILISRAFQSDSPLSENQEIMDRIKGSAVYFSKTLKEEIYALYKAIDVVTDNSAIEEKISQHILDLRKELYIKGMCFDSIKEGFTSEKIISARSNAELDYEKIARKAKPTKSINIASDIIHKDLYRNLVKWRNAEAEKADIISYKVIPIVTMTELTHVLPRSIDSLKLVSGIGKQKAMQYGAAIIEIVDHYCTKHNLPGDQLELAQKTAKKKKSSVSIKGQTVNITLDLFGKHKSIEEIAKERDLSVSTIESHMAKAIAMGSVDINLFIDEEKRNRAAEYFRKSESKELTPAITKLGSTYTYGQLKMIRAWMEWENMEDKEV